MNIILDNLYISEDAEKELWKSCIVSFDSSALLNFYYYSENIKKNIYEAIFGSLKDRLWIPHHVSYEFLINRISTFKKPLSDYDKLINDNLSQIKHHFNEIKNKTKNKERHPFLDHNIFSDFENNLNSFEEILKHEIEQQQNKINNMENNDSVIKAIKSYFSIGTEYTYKQIFEIIQEGDLRYKFKLPPGYKDTDKIGFKAFGDLIIWKQLLDFAQKNKRSVVFITDDKKEDWWVLDRKNNIQRPREELIKEFKDTVKEDIWIYTSAQFYEKAKTILNINVNDDIIKEVKFLNLRIRPEIILEDILPDFLNDLVDTDQYITGAIAETNATGFGLDTYELHEVYYTEEDRKIFFKVLVFYSGDHDFRGDRSYLGDTIIAEISGVIVKRKLSWEIEEYTIDKCEIDFS